MRIRYITIDLEAIRFKGSGGQINAHFDGITKRFSYNNRNMFLTQLLSGFEYLLTGRLVGQKWELKKRN